MNDVEIFKLDDKQVHKLALETRNERLTEQEKEGKAKLPPLKYQRDFRRRAMTGGPLSFIEAKYMVREQLTFDKWEIEFYEVIQFPQVRYFETEYQARKYWGRVKKRQSIKAQKARLKKPAEHIFAERQVEDEYQVEWYEPDALGRTF
jgi:hypothetical protein